MILQKRKNKKKIRGWKRQIRKINHWKKEIMNLNPRELETIKHLHPFHAFKRRQTPLWYQELFLEALMDVSDHWQKKLNQTRDDVELKLWICLPYITDSQIVVSCGESFPPLERTFDPDPLPKPFFGDLFSRLKTRLNQWDWSVYPESEVFTESDLKRSDMTVRKKQQILRKVYQQTELHLCEGKKETIYSVKTGEIWVGRRKQGMIPKSTSYYVCKT